MNSSIDFSPGFFSAVQRPLSIILARHGETAANAEGRIQGRLDFPLNERGRQQAQALAAWFSERRPSLVLSSPQQRASQTAAVIAHSLGLAAPTSLDDLKELDTGCFSGLTMAEAAQAYPEAYEAFQTESWVAVPGAESEASLYARAGRAWQALVAAAARTDGDVLAVSHGGTLQWLVRWTFGCRGWQPLVMTGNCALFELSIRPGRGSALLQWREINGQPAAMQEQAVPVF